VEIAAILADRFPATPGACPATQAASENRS
jgi:hypothetical protein